MTLPPDALAAAMREAIAASEAVRGITSPNPPVGCVVLDADGQRVGIGATAAPGGPHAEIGALEAAGDRARGGTAVVTLEPCAHTGRTGPCTEALAAAGIAEVVYAVADPNPVAAGGARTLTTHGIAVSDGLLADKVRRGPLRAWLHSAATGRPHVTWKFAATLDGRSAAADGTSRWISSAESRAEAHGLRAVVDAVVVGTGTVLADDPALTARDSHGVLAPRQPLRVVVGTRSVPEDFRVRDRAAETLLLATHDPDEVLRELQSRGLLDVLLEGGPALAGAFLAAGRVDRIVAYLAPALLGSGRAALGDAGITGISGMLELDIEDVRYSGGDLRISAVPRTKFEPQEA